MRYLIMTLIAASMFGCSNQVPLTRGLLRDYGLSSSDIPRLQLYLSDGIVLEKRITTIDKNIDSTSYSLKKVEDYYVKQIHFDRGTPCVATSASVDKLAIAFEQTGGELSFIAASGSDATFVYRPDIKSAPDTQDNRPASGGFQDWKKSGDENYADTTFSALVQGDLPCVLVDKTGLKNFTVEARKVKGLRQSELNIK